MRRQGWVVVGNSHNVRLAEMRRREGEYRRDELVTYDQAKEIALETLRGQVEPYLRQIARIEADKFSELGKLPRHKAWRYWNRTAVVVVAKTKKRAIELAETTRYGFDSSWHECDGDWWYSLANEEGVWVEERDEEDCGTGVYLRPLGREEADTVAERHIDRYRSMSAERISSQVGQSTSTTHESTHGTPYRVETTVSRYSWNSDYLTVQVIVDDGLEWQQGSRHHVCEVPKPVKVNWIEEGF